MFRVTLICEGIPRELGPRAALDVAEEFAHRQWHRNVHCSWSGDTLLLVADNAFDPDGKALADEFSDALVACTATTFGYRIRIDSVVKLP